MKWWSILCLSVTTFGLSIKLGLIESDPKLVSLCQRAISDAKAGQQCDQSLE